MFLFSENEIGSFDFYLWCYRKWMNVCSDILLPVLSDSCSFSLFQARYEAWCVISGIRRWIEILLRSNIWPHNVWRAYIQFYRLKETWIFPPCSCIFSTSLLWCIYQYLVCPIKYNWNSHSSSEKNDKIHKQKLT